MNSFNSFCPTNIYLYSSGQRAQYIWYQSSEPIFSGREIVRGGGRVETESHLWEPYRTKTIRCGQKNARHWNCELFAFLID